MDIFQVVEQIRHQEGLEEGIQLGKEESVRQLLAKTKFSPEKIVSLIKVRVSIVRKIKKELSSK